MTAAPPLRTIAQRSCSERRRRERGSVGRAPSRSEWTPDPGLLAGREALIAGGAGGIRNVALVAELFDGWEPGPDASKSPEGAPRGGRKVRQGFVAAGRNPDEAIVRAHLPVAWGDDGGIDLERSFAPAGPMLEAGVDQFAFPLPVGFGDVLRTLGDVGDFFASMARVAAKYRAGASPGPGCGQGRRPRSRAARAASRRLVTWSLARIADT